MHDVFFFNFLFGSWSLEADSDPMKTKHEGRGFPFESSVIQNFNSLRSTKKIILFSVEQKHLRQEESEETGAKLKFCLIFHNNYVDLYLLCSGQEILDSSFCMDWATLSWCYYRRIACVLT